MTDHEQAERLIDVGEHECVTCERCATTFAKVHPACPRCSVAAQLAEAQAAHKAAASLANKLAEKNTEQRIQLAEAQEQLGVETGWRISAQAQLAERERDVERLTVMLYDEGWSQADINSALAAKLAEAQEQIKAMGRGRTFFPELQETERQLKAAQAQLAERERPDTNKIKEV